MNKELIKKLNQNEQDTLKAVGVIHTAKLMRNAAKLYNKLCQKCRANAFNNPRIKISEYCEKCQEKAHKLGFE